MWRTKEWTTEAKDKPKNQAQVYRNRDIWRRYRMSCIITVKWINQRQDMYRTFTSCSLDLTSRFKCFVTRTVLTCGTRAEPWWRAEHQNQAKRGNGTASQCEFHLSWGSSGRSCVPDSHHTRCVRSQGEPGDKRYFTDGRQSLILSAIVTSFNDVKPCRRVNGPWHFEWLQCLQLQGQARHTVTSQKTWILSNSAVKTSKCTPLINYGILGKDDKIILKQILEKRWTMMCAASSWFRTELSDGVL